MYNNLLIVKILEAVAVLMLIFLSGSCFSSLLRSGDKGSFFRIDLKKFVAVPVGYLLLMILEFFIRDGNIFLMLLFLFSSLFMMPFTRTVYGGGLTNIHIAGYVLYVFVMVFSVLVLYSVPPFSNVRRESGYNIGCVASMVLYLLFMMHRFFYLYHGSYWSKEYVTVNSVAINMAFVIYCMLISLLFAVSMLFDYSAALSSAVLVLAMLFQCTTLYICMKYSRYVVKGHEYAAAASVEEPEADYAKQDVLDEIKTRLEDYFMTKRPYLRPDLKLNDVASEIYTNKTYLSRVLNDRMNTNFNRYVNYFRIQEAMSVFKKNNDISMKDLCEISGFKSMASFNQAFRCNTGCSPAEWCKDAKASMKNSDEAFGKMCSGNEERF